MDKKEFILCAAIKRLYPRNCIKHYHINDIYDIEIGYRHCDIFSRFKDEVSTHPKDQGFYTSKGRFVDRKEAMQIAWEAKQISTENAFISNINEEILEDIKNNKIIVIEKELFRNLYSEDLY